MNDPCKICYKAEDGRPCPLADFCVDFLAWMKWRVSHERYADPQEQPQPERESETLTAAERNE